MKRNITIIIFAILILICLSLFFKSYTDLHSKTSIYTETVQQKVKAAHYTREDITLLEKELKKNGFSLDQLQELEPLQMNSYGQTYGPDAFHADLISVVYDNCKTGYIKRQDFQRITDNTLVESKTEKSLPVYESDGKTQLGVFYFSMEIEN